MDYSAFERQWDRLKRVYPATAANEERKKLWWDRFKNDREDIFENALSSVILEATTQTFPAMSRALEAYNAFRPRLGYSSSHMQELPAAYNCDACRDHGFGFVGDTVVACTCSAGHSLGPAKLVKAQRSYDIGRARYPTPSSMGII